MDPSDYGERLRDGALTPEQATHLNQLLRDDPEFLRGLVDDFLLNVAIGDEFTFESALPAANQAAALWLSERHAAPVEVVTERRLPTGEPRPPAEGNRRARFKALCQWASVCAALLIAVCGSSWLTLLGSHGVGPLAWLADEADSQVRPAVAPLARVAATRNCRWGEGFTGLGFGAELSSDEVMRLEAGLAEISFPSGSRVVLEGPASFRISDSESVDLFRGRVTASVPEGSARLSIRTPKLVVSGAGARYGVVAGENGVYEVHAFERGVEASVLNPAGGIGEQLKLGAFEAARTYGGDRNKIQRIETSEESFVRSLDIRRGPGDGLLAIENFEYAVGPLAMQNGGFGWGGVWTELEADSEAETPGQFTNGVHRGSLTSGGVMGVGNHCVQSGNFNRIRRVLATNRGGAFDSAGCIEVVDGFPMVRNTGGAVYISFLQRTSLTDDTRYGFELHRGDGRYNRVLCIGTGIDDFGYGASVSFEQPPGQAKFEPLESEDTKVNFIVIRIDYGEEEKDRVSIYRNPESIVDEDLCVVDAELDGIFGFDRVSIANYFGEKVHEIDEVRIGTDFRAVTGTMKPGRDRQRRTQVTLLQRREGPHHLEIANRAF